MLSDLVQYPLAAALHIPSTPPLTPGQAAIYVVSMDLPILNILYKWNHTIKKKSKCWWDCGEKGDPSYNVGGNVWCSHDGKQYSMEGSQKIKNRTTIQFSNSTPGYIPKENENTNLKTNMYLNIHSSIIYYSQDMEAT